LNDSYGIKHGEKSKYGERKKCFPTGSVEESRSLCVAQGNENPTVTLKSIFIMRDTTPDTLIYICYGK